MSECLSALPIAPLYYQYSLDGATERANIAACGVVK